jgi:hypothetical protein
MYASIAHAQWLSGSGIPKQGLEHRAAEVLVVDVDADREVHRARLAPRRQPRDRDLAAVGPTVTVRVARRVNVFRVASHA